MRRRNGLGYMLLAIGRVLVVDSGRLGVAVVVAVAVVLHPPLWRFVMSRPIRLSLALLALTGVGVSACSSSAKSFLKKAMEGDNSEMRLGQMAVDRGSSPGVRAFGHMLVVDHAKAKTDALPIARAHGLAPTDEMASEARDEAQKLAGLSGAAFDREFASYMVKDHKQDIEDFTKAADGRDQETARLARATLPVLQKHLATAQRLTG